MSTAACGSLQLGGGSPKLAAGQRSETHAGWIATMSVTLTRDEVARVALLARLRLSDDELDRMTRQLGSILGYVERLGEVDTEGVEPMAHAVERTNVFRDDIETPMLPRDAALANAPKTDGQYFLVPQIIEAGKAIDFEIDLGMFLTVPSEAA